MPHAVDAPAIRATEHRLSNGFTVVLSPHDAEPRVHAEIAVRAGSKDDPDASTGLAHYLEHMLFKGTDRLGTRDWEAEQPLLARIAELYEAHRAAPADSPERTRLYGEIDAASHAAARLALPGEYDRLVARMGARHTNAYTWVDQTVFVNDVPAAELGRWLALEAERFRRLVLRLFHTELETVFEEFNISQDRDARKVMRAANEALFAPHPYGTHTTLGRGEHLKAPSHLDIYGFFRRHYVPANMALVLAGDFDEAEALRLAERHFGGDWPGDGARTGVPVAPERGARHTAGAPAPDQPTATTLEVWGQEGEQTHLHFRIPGAGTREADVAQVATAMLHNRQAGLFDTELVRAQRLLSASAGIIPMAEYGVVRASAKPLPGQSLDEAEALVRAQVDRLAAGDYPTWLREAVVVDFELATTRTAEANRGRAHLLTTGFVHGVPLAQTLGRIAALRSVTDDEVRAFAKTYLAPARCVTARKRQGEDAAVMKVDKPAITPVPVGEEGVSGFAERLLAVEPGSTEARFADLDAEVTVRPLRVGAELHHLRNDENGLFELLYVFDFGTQEERWLRLATKYLGFLGTGRLSNAAVQERFYRLGLDWQVQATAHRTYVGLSGLDKHLPEGARLLEDLLRDCRADAERWGAMVEREAQRRRNDRADKQVVLRKALSPYGRYGEASPLAEAPSVDELRAVDAEDLVALVQGLPDRPHAAFYYGPRAAEEAAAVLAEAHPAPAQTRPAPTPRPLRPVRPTRDRVLLTHFPMVQAEVLALRQLGDGFARELWPLAEWYNQYYGVGLSSVVFQELRESRALAYSTYAYAETPQRADGQHVLQAFLGTQPDKLAEALAALRALPDEPHIDHAAAERVRAGMLQQMRTERDLRQSRYWLWRQGRDRGLDGNQRAWLYEQTQRLTPEQLEAFAARVAAAPTTYLVLGDRERLDADLLGSYGELRELSLDEAFGEVLEAAGARPVPTSA